MKKGLQMKIWEFLDDNPSVTTKEISLVMNVCYDRVRSNVARMLKNGYVTRESKHGVGFYTASKKPIRSGSERLSSTYALGNSKQIIYTYLFTNPNVTAREVSDSLKIPLSTVRNRLKDLEDYGAVLSDVKIGDVKRYKSIDTAEYVHLKTRNSRTVEDVLKVAKTKAGVFGMMAAQLI